MRSRFPGLELSFPWGQLRAGAATEDPLRTGRGHFPSSGLQQIFPPVQKTNGSPGIPDSLGVQPQKLSVGAELEVQLGTGDEEVVLVVPSGGRNHRNSRPAGGRSKRADHSIKVVIVLIEADESVDLEGVEAGQLDIVTELNQAGEL